MTLLAAIFIWHSPEQWYSRTLIVAAGSRITVMPALNSYHNHSGSHMRPVACLCQYLFKMCRLLWLSNVNLSLCEWKLNFQNYFLFQRVKPLPYNCTLNFWWAMSSIFHQISGNYPFSLVSLEMVCPHGHIISVCFIWVEWTFHSISLEPNVCLFCWVPGERWWMSALIFTVTVVH